MNKLIEVVGFNPDAWTLRNKLTKKARKNNSNETYHVKWHNGGPGKRGWAVFNNELIEKENE